MTVQMFDSTSVSVVPADAPAVAGYVGGHWPTYFRLVQMFPRAHHLSIAINASEDAECLDIEYLDATPDEAPGWVKRQFARGVERPVVYSSLSSMPSVVRALEDDGIRASSVRLWTAHYNMRPHLCGPEACGLTVTAGATQWTNHALNLNLDESLCDDEFFGPPPPPPDPNQYDRYPHGPFPFRKSDGKLMHLDERAIVEEYDHLRIHAHMNAERLDELRSLLTFLRKRVWYVAHYDPSSGDEVHPPAWSPYHRGWRYQMLLKRSRGERVAS